MDDVEVEILRCALWPVAFRVPPSRLCHTLSSLNTEPVGSLALIFPSFFSFSRFFNCSNRPDVLAKRCYRQQNREISSESRFIHNSYTAIEKRSYYRSSLTQCPGLLPFPTWFRLNVTGSWNPHTSNLFLQYYLRTYLVVVKIEHNLLATAIIGSSQQCSCTLSQVQGEITGYERVSTRTTVSTN